MLRVAAFCLALVHSLRASSEEAIQRCICMVCIGKTSSDGRERVHVFIVCQVRVVGTVGGAPNSSGQELVFAAHVYMIVDRKGLILWYN